ncbi:cysteine-rich motor neuron 1 protein-like isoform X2 [Anneissia japonica]|uniref:cysteine-rich motor neuron 1 protein-like isoform X2 n=1 Tax=Anneissia japonica TaxID=1529436 RepID=UPI0014258C4D|nr:cysteine-rich motor neuron 1 protein-like isoform X2 [Anneissia japonica]
MMASSLIYTNSGIVLLTISLSLLSRLSFGLSCEPCYERECVRPICKGGLVFDVCNCCPVCAKIEGEKCGGPWGLFGTCDDGLHCKGGRFFGDHVKEGVEDDLGVCTALELERSSGDHEDCVQTLFSGCNIRNGVCQCDNDVLECDNPFAYANYALCQDALWRIASENGALGPAGSIPPSALLREDTSKDCSNIKCVIVNVACPNDSITVIPPSDPTKCCDPPRSCRCDTSRCDDIICAGGYEKVLVSAGDGHPGTCCDHFQCRPLNCSNVECPPSLPRLCPVNSRYISGGVSADGCCLLPSRCECASELCVMPTCEEGYELRLIAEGQGDPDNCCPVYKCINQSIKDGCTYQGIPYRHRETWQPETCRRCECWNGISRCMPIPDCQDFTIPPTILKALCEVDEGLYEHGDEWDHDDCTTCRCVQGKVQCTGASCAITCMNAKKIPGVCCPVCDEPDIITVPSLPCPQLNCSLDCPHGFTKDNEGCPLCNCAAVSCPELSDCPLHCANGLAEDSQGCRICSCKSDPAKCSPVNTCSKYCIYGFQNDRWGCPRCKCKRCPDLTDCTLQCPNGFKKNDRGCNICRCAVKLTETPKPVTVLVDLGSCQSFSKQYEDSESWHDGCRECYCHNGQEMCTLIACTVPACESPVIRTGECCPSCPDSESNTIPHINLKVCHSTGGHYYVEGETWHIDMCTKCVCHNGHVLCSVEACPPLPCDHPSIDENKCCPHCSDIHTDGSGDTENMPCEETDGLVYEDGSTWKEDDCTSCKCEMGEVTCYSNTCPPANCKTPVLRKGQCCPSCLQEPEKTCEISGAVYLDGQHWTTDRCILCVCQQGIPVCTLPECPQLKCKNPVMLPGECCKKCPSGGENTPSVITLKFPGGRTTSKTLSDRARPRNPFKLYTLVPTRITIPEADSEPSSFPVLPVALAILVVLLAVLIVIAMFLYVTKWRHHVDYQIKSKPLPPPPVTIMSIKKKNVDVKNSNRDSIRDSANFKENKVQGNMFQDTKRNLDSIDMKRLSDYYGVGKSIQPV